MDPQTLSNDRSIIPTYPALLTALTDFLTVSVHTILYHRNIYPAEIFVKARKYSFPVYQCRHERVCRWVGDAMRAVGGEIGKANGVWNKKGNVATVSLILLSPGNVALERFVFNLSSFPPMQPDGEGGGGGDSLMFQPPDEEDGGRRGGREMDEVTVAGLEAQFRDCMMRLSIAAPDLGKLPEDCTYTIALEMKESDAPMNYAEVWAPAEGQGSDGTGIRRGGGGAKTTDIRTVEADSICLELSIEETTTKTKMVFEQ
ncbi:DNA-binding protein [Choiromyces venosus 120613-1]|uniref:DNA-binding protein n=1 Tax=Choiromyces venosus 120613-1 TaxID=1336337 RepID=A0A3N4KBZ5_9PEZI|nr:DNA-binding protein [Choiromyces venosus 120613-1]